MSEFEPSDEWKAEGVWTPTHDEAFNAILAIANKHFDGFVCSCLITDFETKKDMYRHAYEGGMMSALGLATALQNEIKKDSLE